MALARVVVVEDERIVALNIKQRLLKLGYEVPVLATSGQAALDAIVNERPDVVLMDINIEGSIDGVETASRIPDDVSVALIYLTAYSEEATLERARMTKPYGYLLKPFSERELHATIQMALQRREADEMIRNSEAHLKLLVADRTSELEAANVELKLQIAERRKAEEALHQAQKMEAIGQLTGGLAHDFNNLLQGISGALQLVRKRIREGRFDEVDPFIDGALASSGRAAALTNRLLAFARRTPVELHTVNCAKLVSAMEDLLHRTVGEAVLLEIKAADDLWTTRCDHNQLESAILNLVINARDSMPDRGNVTIHTCNVQLDVATAAQGDLKPGQYVCIAVTDTGVGMDADTANRAFEPFFTTKPLGQGTGLGLSMVYGFARQHHGFTRIVSEPGKGTTVKIYLPRLMIGAPYDEAKPGSGAVDMSGLQNDGEVVLVVEDDEVVRGIVLEVLRELGCETLHAADGPSGLEILRSRHRIDLLVTDVGLPGLNGRQVADAARELRPELKVLFMTGYAENALISDGGLAAGMGVMRKPFGMEEFAGRIREILKPPRAGSAPGT